MTAADFTALAAKFPDETVTHSYVRDVELPGAGTSGPADPGQRPGPPQAHHARAEHPGGTGHRAGGAQGQAAAGGISAVAVTGKPYYLVAGADLGSVGKLTDPEDGRAMARLGHDAYATLATMGVPTFAFINGAAMGGGLEIALAADYRTVSAGANGISLPEAFLGLIPGWGGVYRLPRLIGPANAVKVMIENPLSNNKMLNGAAALPTGHRRRAVRAGGLPGTVAGLGRPDPERRRARRQVAIRRADKSAATEADWDQAIAAGRAFVEAKTANAAPAPAKVLDVMEAGRGKSQQHPPTWKSKRWPS